MQIRCNNISTVNNWKTLLQYMLTQNPSYFDRLWIESNGMITCTLYLLYNVYVYFYIGASGFGCLISGSWNLLILSALFVITSTVSISYWLMTRVSIVFSLASSQYKLFVPCLVFTLCSGVISAWWRNLLVSAELI